MLICKKYFTVRSHIRITGFTIYSTQYTDSTARGGTAVLIQNNKLHPYSKVKTAHLQVTNILIEGQRSPLIVYTVYCAPKHRINETDFKGFLRMLGAQFLMGGEVISIQNTHNGV